MRKQPIIIALVAVIVLALGAITFAIYKTAQSNPSDNTQLNNTAAQEEALEKARAYQPPEGTMCTQVMTPAVHEDTGATHTFTSGCLPDGWKKSESSDASPRSSEHDHGDENSVRSSEANPEANRRDDTARPLPVPTARSENQASKPTDTTNPRNNRSPQDRALREAHSYRPAPDMMCTQVLTPATHKATGVRYTFPTGCIPDGWVRDSDRTPRFTQ